MEPLQLLHEYFGHTSFRTGQAEAIDALLQGKDVLAVMPTGAGKSVCYQIPAMILPGLTLVISPLISLMKDQVESLHQAGIPAACINSSMTSEEYQMVMYEARQGHVRLLYVAPERLMTESFLRFAANMSISMITVDEAHCVSQWGQDFRQSYLDIAKFVQTLPQRPVIGAFTATATQQVCQDIIQFLMLHDPVRITTGFDRKNLYFGVEMPKDKSKALLSLLQQYKGKSGIVYCLSRKLVEQVCEELCHAGFVATRYHAGLTPEERAVNQEDFLYDRKTVMVATNAFGMGIDKSNVSFVIHYNMPKDLESYYQEAGRAGRDGEPAACILLYGGKDVRTNQFLIEQSRETAEVEDRDLRESLIAKSKERLKTMTIYSTSADCLRSYMLRYFGETAPPFCGNCSACLNHAEKKDITLEAMKIISCVYRGQQKRYHLSRTMAASVLTGSTKKTLLDMHLDQLSTYGIMRDYSVAAVLQMMDAMIAGGDLGLRPYKEYSELVLTAGSAAIIRKEKRVEVQLPKRETTTAQQEMVSEADEALFQCLRKLRERIAAKEHVPPYVVFSNAALRDMCRRKPENMQEFMLVSGVGVMRSQKYGRSFLKEIKGFLESVS
ncbi:MAG: DNA helicase RecQ [Ruminococcus sp.]